MRIRLILPREAPDPECPLFRSPFVEQRTRWFPLAGSVALHTLGLLAWLLGGHLLEPDAREWAAYRAELLRVQVPKRIYYTANLDSVRKPGSRKPLRGRASSSAGPDAGSGAGKWRPPIPPELELPAPRETAGNVPILLQPDSPIPPGPVNSAVPPLAFWARSAEPPSHSRPRLVIPGRAEAPSPPPALPVAPVLAVPNREFPISDRNVAMSPANAQPVLPVPNSATVPIRLHDAAGVPGTASFERMQGQPLNLIALGGEFRPAGEVVEVPKGLVNIPAARGEAETMASGAGSRKRDSEESHGGRTTAANAPVEFPGRAPGVSASVESGKGLTRIAHPANGNFEVVVTQSASRDDLSDVGGILTGNPVYSVYLRVGDAKEWLLEYCLPAHAGSRKNPYQVDVDDPPPLSPPYPVSTVIPDSILSRQHVRKIFHAYLTTLGSFRDIEARGAGDPFASEMLPLLNQWRFRPASNGHTPTEVEVLLVIPPRA